MQKILAFFIQYSKEMENYMHYVGLRALQYIWKSIETLFCIVLRSKSTWRLWELSMKSAPLVSAV